jgi:hypothetical protein
MKPVWTQKLTKGEAVAVYAGDDLIGYIFRVVGGFDAWRLSHPNGRIMEKVAANLRTPTMAIKAITGE